MKPVFAVKPVIGPSTKDLFAEPPPIVGELSGVVLEEDTLTLNCP